jgi:putative membrane protein insertion efficiency factor
MTTARMVAGALDVAIRAYQVALSPWLGGQCRFHPTCSAYAREAIAVHGPVSGLVLSARRILRCQPFGRGGHDPVPTKPGEKNA